MATLLLISLGKLSGAVLEGTVRSGAFERIVVASRNPVAARARIHNARIGAAIEGRFPAVEAVEFDFNAHGAGRVLAGIAPDVAFAAPSLMPWWALDRLDGEVGERVRAVPFAGFMAFHLAPMLRLREAWDASGLRCPWIGASYPDVVNAVLARTGPAPTCGIGNVAEIVPKVRFVVSEALGCAPAECDVRLVAQHALEYFVYSDGAPPHRPPYRLSVEVKGCDVTAVANERLFAPFPIPYDLDFNRITASAGLTVLKGLLGDDDVLEHVPAPAGRVGGYPVRLSRHGVRLALPPAWTEEEAVAINETSLAWDGIAELESDGTVRFTDACAAALRPLLRRSVTSLVPADAEAMAAELLVALSA
ncbi:hypothetical protein [Azospirillum sp.]|uniref:hypothetical protein n=1 Tax=Azospirillum sp. TaxID=34012 RepID=UPI003D764618